jgi:hypothetical protein
MLVDIRLFTAQLKDLNDRFYVLLDEMVKNYPKYRTSAAAGTGTASTAGPSTASADYEKNRSDMKRLENEYFLFKNSVIKENEKMSAFGKNIETQMKQLDADSGILKDSLNSLKGSDGSAAGLLDDTQLTRNQMVFGNVILALCMLIGGYIYYTKNKSNAPTSIVGAVTGAVTGASDAIKDAVIKNKK